MMDEMRKFIRSRRNCVLATCGDGQPHCSLMSYLVEDNAQIIYLISKKGTKKYANIMANPKVSLLIDDRSTACPVGQLGLDKVKALTVNGHCELLEDPGRAGAIKRLFSVRYPHLEGLLAEPDAVILFVEVEHLSMREGALKEHYSHADR